VVRTPEGEVLIDTTGKKAGRGAYVCPEEVCFAKAYKDKKFEKALGHVIEPIIYETLRSGLKR
jgi:predicted RNA-binding protein YlxR (DUF448 family)